MYEPTWTKITITVRGREIDGEYCRDGHLVKVKHSNREKGVDLGNSSIEGVARDLLRELGEEGQA
jgi:hypothetical protein